VQKLLTMRALASAVVEALAFLELSDDDQVDSAAAVGAMEAIVARLKDATEEELRALRAAVLHENNERNKLNADEHVLDFYENFFEHFGLE